jgi:hypothetical protein
MYDGLTGNWGSIDWYKFLNKEKVDKYSIDQGVSLINNILNTNSPIETIISLTKSFNNNDLKGCLKSIVELKCGCDIKNNDQGGDISQLDLDNLIKINIHDNTHNIVQFNVFKI